MAIAILHSAAYGIKVIMRVAQQEATLCVLLHPYVASGPVTRNESHKL